MTLAIETRQVGKSFGAVRAVDDLSLKVAEGEIYAFLGLNGAGKTTTIHMLLGMIRPSGGEVHVLGTPVRLGQRGPWSQVGYLVETARFYPELTVLENLEVSRRLHPGTPPEAVKRIVERLNLGEYAKRRAGNLSLGNGQRLGLAKALLHNPRLLILDEPANGLDPAGIVEVRALLQELAREQGVTIFMSSHILAEVSRLAERIGIIHRGRLIEELNVEELEHRRLRRLVVRTRNLNAARQALLIAGQEVETLPDGSLALNGNGSLDRPDEIARLLMQAEVPPTHLVVEEEDLEHYFLRLVGEEEKS